MLFNLKTQILPPIGIIGLGRSGQSAKKLLLASGFNQDDIFTFDEKSADADFNNRDAVVSSKNPKTLVVSPGFPLSDSLIQNWKASGAKITSEINLACAFLTDEKIVGITGSLGKSTTTSLIGAGLLSIDPNAFIGGNLGTPFCEYAIEVLLHPEKKAQWIALELSSYQLENSESLSLDYGIITYLTPNHLERYNNLDHYYDTKWKLLSMTKEKVILNSNGGDIETFATRRKLSNIQWSTPWALNLKKFQLSSAVILGKHNQNNLALAANFIIEADLPESAIEAIKQFKGLSHRLEVVGKSQGLLFINDSKATTIDSVETAIQTCLQEPNYKRLVVLIGGKDKKLPWLQLKETLENTKILPLFFGESGQYIQQTLDMDGPYYKNLNTLLQEIKNHIKTDDIVLLSPGGTSHDEFKNFEERGDFFKNWVKTNYLV